MSDIRSYNNPFKPRFSQQAQAAKLTGKPYIEDKTGKVIDVLIRSIRPGSLIEVVETFLLAPVHGGPKKRRRILGERFGTIKERGGVIWERATDDRSNNKAQCARMLLRAYEMISNSGRGAPGRSQSGRPSLVLQPDQARAMTAIWCSRAYKTRDEAVAALNAAGYKVSRPWCYRHLGQPDQPKHPPDVPADIPKIAARRVSRSLVYFIRDGEMVKIGSSANPSDRLKNMAVGNGRNLELLASLCGGQKRERALHKRFHKDHIKGEWFRLSAVILKYIAASKRKRRKAK